MTQGKTFMKCFKLLFGITLAAALHALSPTTLAQNGDEKALTSYIGCLRDPIPDVPPELNWQLVSANTIGFDRVFVWRQACLNDPTQSAILIRVFPHYPDYTLLTGSLISAIQDGQQVGPFNLLQHTRDVDGYTGYLNQPKTFILAQTNTLPRLLDENGQFKLLFMTGGAAASLDIPSKASTLPQYAQVTEFASSATGEYFITANPAEADYLDRGGAGGVWSRTGLGFRVWTTEVGGGMPVCRFMGTPGLGPNSHFFSAFPAECAFIANQPEWQFEGVAFFAAIPGATPDNCPAQTQYVYRLFNPLALGNNIHRYLTDYELAMSMVAAGWIYEGPTMCVPR